MTAYYNEFDPQAAAWLRELIRRGLIADGDVDERSIVDVRPDDLRGYTQCHFFGGIGGWSYALRLAGWPDDRPVWTGSPPCQPFSPAGLGLGRDDARHLGPHFVDLVRACRPDMLFGEQVASSAVFGRVAKVLKRAVAATIGFPEWAWWDDLSVRLEHAQYAVGAGDIPAASVGAPHIRQRCFFGAVWLADADGGRQQGQGVMGRRCDTAQGFDREINRVVDDDWRDGLADANRDGRDTSSLDRRDAGQCDAQSRGGFHVMDDSGRPGADHSFWSDADWIFGRDGVWRPVEPGTQPLADGVPARMVRLRGYGNAIVPQVAAQFIAAFSSAAQHMRTA